MEAISTPLSGLKIIIPTVHGDDRGFFKEIIHPQKLAAVGINHRFVQMNHSRSQQWTLRGLHFQLPPYGQSKLVRCLRGRIYDVAVDVRPKSPTFGQSFGIELTEDNHKMLYVPVGFAHGFLALTDCDIEYACGDICMRLTMNVAFIGMTKVWALIGHLRAIRHYYQARIQGRECCIQ